MSIDTRADKYAVGKKNLKTLKGKPSNSLKAGPNAIAPAIDTFLKEHLFVDIFSWHVVTFAQRELATVSTVASKSGVESQLQVHLGMNVGIGIIEAQLGELIRLVEPLTEKQQADTDRKVLENRLYSQK